jgi:DNA-binding transcriptional ArsR family regulator
VELDAAAALAADLFRALGHPLRVVMLAHLADGPLGVSELQHLTEAAQPLVSQHLRVLRLGGLVCAERTGQSVVYRIADDHVAHVVRDAVAHVREPHPSGPPRNT